ncbi:MAG: hypothetical protein V1904_11290 [Bacteroidota bacterium]
MKTIFKTTLLIFMVSVIAFSFTTCKDDPECEAVITVKLQSDTNLIIPNATVEIKKQDVYISGISDASGRFRHTFKLEAILDVTAEKGDTLGDTLYGQTVIRLKPSETVYKTVFVDTVY